MVMNKILQKIGGVPKCIVFDNMKTAVTKSDKYESNINQVFEDFGNHYQTCIVSTRTFHPKDKVQVENHVKIIYSKVMAPLRNKVFTSVNEVNNSGLIKLIKYFFFSG
jgi:transposase